MRSGFAALALFAASLLHAQERTLSWKALDVTAGLENDATLRISERHHMLFDGAWNGGERIFRVEQGQELVLLGMSRIDGDGKLHDMAEAGGPGIGLHEYRFDGQTLRWRARETSDPPFRNEERVYIIDYLLRHVVNWNGESYVLAHDFAFRDRPGPIESFTAKIEVGPAWQAPADFVPTFERANLPPAESAILTVQLQWTGEGQPQYLARAAASPASAPAMVSTSPAAAPAEPPPPRTPLSARLLGLGAFVVAAAWMTRAFIRREQELGRYEPPPEVTPQWLEKNLLVHRAEVVGTAWDGATGPGEVAALIATMTAEGKIENAAGTPKLRLLVPRENLSEYERGFVDALFIDGDEIEPATLRRHYRETGFHPSGTIALPLMAAAAKLVGASPRASWVGGCAAFILCVFIVPVAAIAFAMSLAIGASYRNGLRGLRVARMVPVPFFLGALVQAFIDFYPGWHIGSFIGGLALLWSALRIASWRGTKPELENLFNFFAAREYLRQRIVQRDDAVDPRWIPYMLAFGLVPDDRWSVTAPRRPDQPANDDDPARHEIWAPSSSSTHDGRSPSPAFQAGGGRFGGAGATGSWASIQTFATAVAARPSRAASIPSSGSSWSSASSGSGWSWSSSGSSSSSSSRSSSSSSSSRSSSSSSSRSGGGGGGGW